MRADNCAIGYSEYFGRYFFLGVPPGSLSEAERQETMALMSNSTALGNELKELASPVRPDGGSRLRELLSRLDLQFDYSFNKPDRNVEGVLRAFFAVGDELLSESPMADGSDPERLAVAKEMYNVTRAVLSKTTTQAERLKLLAAIFVEAEALFTMSYHVNEFSREPDEQHATLETWRLVTLKGVAVERLRKAARDGSLRSAPFLGYVLARYSEWADEAEVREYLRALIQTDQGLCDCLIGLMYRQEKDGAIVEELVSDKQEALMHRCRDLLNTGPAWLTGRHRAALEAYMERAAGGTAS